MRPAALRLTTESRWMRPKTSEWVTTDVVDSARLRRRLQTGQRKTLPQPHSCRMSRALPGPTVGGIPAGERFLPKERARPPATKLSNAGRAITR